MIANLFCYQISKIYDAVEDSHDDMNVDDLKYQNLKINLHVFLTFMTCVPMILSYHVALTSNEMNLMLLFFYFLDLSF